MFGKKVMWSPIIIVGEEYIDNGNNIKGAPRYTSRKMFVTGYIENNLKQFWAGILTNINDD